jgi:hypothetical protein
MLPLDVRQFRRRALLRPGRYILQWETNGDAYASMGLTVWPDRLRLEYSCAPRGGDPVSCQNSIGLVRLPCRFGGERAYFLCPDCGRRCEVLYGPSRFGGFACRLCLRLGYASESESPVDRTWRRQRKLEARLDDDGGKPAWMRWRTFEAIIAAIDAQEERRDEFAGPALLRLLARLEPDGGWT